MRSQPQPHFSQDRAVCPRCTNREFLTQPVIYPRSYARTKILQGIQWICFSCSTDLEYLVLEIEAKHRKKPLSDEDYKEIHRSFMDN